jgi:hypothetical protein
MQPELSGIVQRLKEQWRGTQIEVDKEPLPKRWVELIVLLNRREKAEPDQNDRGANVSREREF